MAMTPEERREKDRERKRRKRAEERAAREATIAAKTNPEHRADVPSMVAEVKVSLQAMKWLQPSDAASVAQAKALAAEIDAMTEAGDTAKALSAHRALSRVLNDLGGTPTVRLQHELRSLKLGRRTEEGDDGDGEDGSEPGAQGGAIVSRFERPAKKARR